MFYVIFGKLVSFGFFGELFWKILNYNFQSRRQIMTARGVYGDEKGEEQLKKQQLGQKNGK